ncbi:cell wall integrity and stress response component 3-like [Lytechinus variegatus]|uniref:cell wall integrity and stress response component 3-like n=1 Tax=Lytechinus variegatus TaxID=7654 RepID=UPI001BB1E4AF|nr:cell wall integrity and stress response component 3-like [Lytechinus variegatus]
MATHIVPRFVTVIVLRFVLMTAFLQMASVRADSEHGPGFVGCYPVGNEWQEFLDKDDVVVENVEGCVLHCREFEYATITAGKSCYCSDGFEDIKRATDESCNVRCDGNPCQICGARTYYSVYNTTAILKRMTLNGGLSCCKVNDSSNYGYAECMASRLVTTTMESYEITTTMPARFPTTQVDQKSTCSEELVKQCCHPSYSLWLRIVIEVVVILVLFLIILCIIIVRCFTKRGNARSDHRLRSIVRQDNTNATTSPRPGAFYQSLIVNSSVQNVQSATDVIPSLNTHAESHQPTMPDSAGEPMTSVSLQGNTESETQMPSTRSVCPKESDDADHRPIAVDGEGYVPMDRISRVSVNVQNNAKFSNDGVERRVTNQARLNYENSDVWRKRDRRTYIKDRMSPE